MENHDCCFHVLNGGHMIPYHIDTQCCFCLKSACLNLRPHYNLSHGPHAGDKPHIEIQIPRLEWPHTLR